MRGSVTIVGAVAATLLAIGTPIGDAAPALAPIQPGAALGSGTPAHCTLDFVFRTPSGTWFIGAAAHCVSLGERVSNNEAGTFGTVVVDDVYANPGGIDFALIQIDAAKTNLVSPAVRGWGGPTGVASSTNAAPGDLLSIHGYAAGIGYGYPATARQLSTAQNKVGVFSRIVGGFAVYDAYTIPGDSGAPILLNKDGTALGLDSTSSIYAQVPDVPALDKGPSVGLILTRMAGMGYSLTLQTAPYNAIPG